MANKINNLYRIYEELDNQFEDEENQDRKNELADERDDIFEQMNQLTKKYLIIDKDFKKLDLSNNWKKNDFVQNIGSRAEVMHGNAKKTSGGLTKKDLKYNKSGNIVSKKASVAAKKNNNLVNAGYVTKKGKFGSFKLE